jgi:uncharacterized repeat protein (TIGR04052 family)
VYFYKRLACAVGCLLLVACQPETPVTFKFIPVYNGAPIECEKTWQHQQQTGWQIRTLQFFVTNLTLENDMQKQEFSLQTTVNSNPTIGLVGGQCQQSDYWQLSALSAPDFEEGTLSFDLGVPFELNHNNPLRAPAPLDQADMFWSWQMGHKFLRLDVANPSDARSFSYHLGSTGCDAVSSLRAPKTPCQHPNLVTITLKDFKVNQPIYLDLAVLLKDVTLNQDNRCMSEQNNPVCLRLFGQLQRDKVFYQ